MGPGFLQHLQNLLHLTPSQEQQWTTFQQAYRITSDDIARERDADAKLPGLSAPQRMDLAIDMAQHDLEGLRRRAMALKAFYAILSPDQQKIFDRETLPPGPGGP